jgi:hypothetical protein
MVTRDVLGDKSINAFSGRSACRIVEVVGVIDIGHVVMQRQRVRLTKGLGEANAFVAQAV